MGIIYQIIKSAIIYQIFLQIFWPIFYPSKKISSNSRNPNESASEKIAFLNTLGIFSTKNYRRGLIEQIF